MMTLSELIKRRGSLIGTFATLGVEACETACYCGLDLVVADAQHGSYSLDDMRHVARLAEASGCMPVARIPCGGAWMIESLLDAGYQALIAPMVNTAEQASDFVRSCYYPPLGVRSQSHCRASMRHVATYRETFNAEFACLVMIEHVDAVKNIDDILALPGISGCFVGPTDLLSSIGPSSDESLKALRHAIEEVRQAAQRAGKMLGIAASTVENAKEYAANGFGFVTVSTDRKLLSDATSRIATSWRA